MAEKKSTYCASCDSDPCKTGNHVFGREPQRPGNVKFIEPFDNTRAYRIEALRAASRVVASRRWWEKLTFRGDTGQATVFLAEQFAKWLESGDDR